MLKKTLSLTVIICFFLNTLGPICPNARSAEAGFVLPAPGTMVNLSPAYEPVMIRGLTVHKDNPFLFDFIVDVGQDKMSGEPLKKEGEKLIKYFMASLAIPDKDVWVNLSPYEKNKMIPEALGQTDMGRDLLEQDYMLKQITASLIYPEKDLGRKFWDKVYAKARQMYGTTQIPVNTFNKVWIMADRAEMFERNQTAFVVEGHLKVMLEEDYLALQKHSVASLRNDTHSIGANIVRQIILPQLEKEVNTGKNFANLRQIFNSVLLASWYKRSLKEALLNQVYADKSKVKGINLKDPGVKEEIYQQYLRAYKKGVFNYIKEDIDTANGTPLPRKYFSGGVMKLTPADFAMTQDPETLEGLPQGMVDMEAGFNTRPQSNSPASAAMTATRFLSKQEPLQKNILTHMDVQGMIRLYTQLKKIHGINERVLKLVTGVIGVTVWTDLFDRKFHRDEIKRLLAYLFVSARQPYPYQGDEKRVNIADYTAAPEDIAHDIARPLMQQMPAEWRLQDKVTGRLVEWSIHKDHLGDFINVMKIDEPDNKAILEHYLYSGKEPASKFLAVTSLIENVHDSDMAIPESDREDLIHMGLLDENGGMIESVWRIAMEMPLSAAMTSQRAVLGTLTDEQVEALIRYFDERFERFKRMGQVPQLVSDAVRSIMGTQKPDLEGALTNVLLHSQNLAIALKSAIKEERSKNVFKFWAIRSYINKFSENKEVRGDKRRFLEILKSLPIQDSGVKKLGRQVNASDFKVDALVWDELKKIESQYPPEDNPWVDQTLKARAVQTLEKLRDITREMKSPAKTGISSLDNKVLQSPGIGKWSMMKFAEPWEVYSGAKILMLNGLAVSVDGSSEWIRQGLGKYLIVKTGHSDQILVILVQTNAAMTAPNTVPMADQATLIPKAFRPVLVKPGKHYDIPINEIYLKKRIWIGALGLSYEVQKNAEGGLSVIQNGQIVDDVFVGRPVSVGKSFSVRLVYDPKEKKKLFVYSDLFNASRDARRVVNGLMAQQLVSQKSLGKYAIVGNIGLIEMYLERNFPDDFHSIQPVMHLPPHIIISSIDNPLSLKVVDMAMGNLNPGGIDLNTSNGMQWQDRKDGNGVVMNVDPALIARIRREGIDSLSPEIYKITPVPSIWPLVGLPSPAIK